MDTLTHALSGALIARATWNDKSRLTLKQRTNVGALVAAFPDIDFILRFSDENLLTYLNYHRGITHSVIMLPLWALLLSYIIAKILRRPESWKNYFGICCLGLGIHIIGDVITSYGTMIFAPFSNLRVWLDTTFIIDPWFTGIIIIALIGTFRFNNKQLVATCGLILLTSYVGLQTWAHHQAIIIGEQATQKHWWRDARVAALPQPLSPFNWKILVEHDEHYHTGLVRLFGGPLELDDTDSFFGKIASAYQPPDRINWTRFDRYGYDRYKSTLIKVAWQSDANADFRQFTRFPAHISNNDLPVDCHWFTDIRFILPGEKTRSFFTFGLCPDQDSDVFKLQHQE